MKKIRSNPKKPAVSQQTLRFKLSIVSLALALLFFGHYPFLSVAANTSDIIRIQQQEALEIANQLKTEIRDTGETVSGAIEKIQAIERENEKLQTEITFREENESAKRTRFKRFTGSASFNGDISSISRIVGNLENKLTQLQASINQLNQDISTAERKNSNLHADLSRLNYPRQTYQEQQAQAKRAREEEGRRNWTRLKKKVFQLPQGYSSWNEFHEAQRRKDMERGR